MILHCEYTFTDEAHRTLGNDLTIREVMEEGRGYSIAVPVLQRRDTLSHAMSVTHLANDDISNTIVVLVSFPDFGATSGHSVFRAFTRQRVETSLIDVPQVRPAPHGLALCICSHPVQARR